MDTIYRFHHDRFGELEVPESAVFRFDGLPGFEGIERFALLEHDPSSSFAWLVSLDDPSIAFAVADPREFFADYAPNLAKHHRRAIEFEEGDEYELLAIATVRDGAATLNLAAPILVNPRTRRATQAILDDECHPLRATLNAEQVPQHALHRSASTQIESNPQR